MTVKYERPAEGAALITLARPDKLNSFNRQLRADLTAALARAGADDAVRAVVMTGEGRAFCAGADVSAVDEMGNVEDVLNTEYAGFLNIIQSTPKPVIAAINGPAAGIGMTTALTCDLRVMGEGAYLMSAFANIGLVPDAGASWFLNRLVGYSRAFEIAALGERITAEQSLELGLTNWVTGADTLAEDALARARHLAQRPTIALGMTKTALQQATQEGLARILTLEADLQAQAAATADHLEGVTAFVEKRTPLFRGR